MIDGSTSSNDGSLFGSNAYVTSTSWTTVVDSWSCFLFWCTPNFKQILRVECACNSGYTHVGVNGYYCRACSSCGNSQVSIIGSCTTTQDTQCFTPSCGAFQWFNTELRNTQVGRALQLSYTGCTS